MKAGTHLMQELMVALGYGIYGQTRITSDIRPVLAEATRRRIAGLVHDEKALAELESDDERSFVEATDRAWEALAWAWQIRLGMPLIKRYGRAVIETELVEQARHRSAASNFADTPPGVCWIFTELDVNKVDGHFLEEWMRTGEPRIIFNYRDPRDVVLSMVNFLAGRTAKGYGNFNEFPVFNRILQARGTLEEQLNYALSDPSFPGYRAYENALWLLNHPDVCKVSFEELVGPQGGGSATAQLAAVRRVVGFLGLDADPGAVAARLYRRDAFSFFKGQIGSWREVFTPRHCELFYKRSGDILSPYGYE
jgi:hypothetical protein